MDDEFRQQYNGTTNKIDLNQAGIRHFSVSALIESYDQSDGRQALEYTERIRSCLGRPQILAMFREVNLTVRDVTATVDLSDVEDDHVVSKASIDILFSYGNNEGSEEPGLEPLDWIERVAFDDPDFIPQ